MSKYNISNLFPFKRVKITKFSVSNDGSLTIVHIEPDKRYLPICSGCRSQVKNIHSHNVRAVRDLHMSGSSVIIYYKYRTIYCERCGCLVEYHDFIEPYSRVTNRFALYVYDLCQDMTIKDAAKHCKLSWHQVKRIDKSKLIKKFSKIDLENLSILCIDEISLKKHHNYLTIIANYLTGQVIKVIKDRDYTSVRNYLIKLPIGVRENIEAVAMDMWDAYIKAFSEIMPHTNIVFDCFHVVSAFSKVIDKIRSEQFKIADDFLQKLMKKSRYLLLKNPENLSTDERPRLKRILKNNQLISSAYILMDYLKKLWQYKYRKSAMKFLEYWCSLAYETKCQHLIKFAKMLKRYSYGIINHCKFSIHTGKLEGLNNKIKVIKRTAYGFHDLQYFSLKIIQATTN